MTQTAEKPKPLTQPKQPPPGNQLATLKDALERSRDKIAEVAQAHLKPERLIRLLLSACSRNPKLLACTKESVLQFSLKCAETGLEPIGPGGAWPIPFENRKNNSVELQFIPDYRGLIHCAKRAGCITDAFAEVVKEADSFDYTLGLEMSLHHKPARGDRGKLTDAYCIFTLPDGTRRFVVMDRSEIESIKRRSRAANNGPWVTDEAEMWKKTVVRRAMKPFAGASAQLSTAMEFDAEPEQPEPVQMPRAALPQNGDGAEGEKPDDAAPEPEDKSADELPATDQQQLHLRSAVQQKAVPEAAVQKMLKGVGAKALKTLSVGQADKVLAMLDEWEG